MGSSISAAVLRELLAATVAATVLTAGAGAAVGAVGPGPAAGSAGAAPPAGTDDVGPHARSAASAGEATCSQAGELRFGRRHYVEQRGDVARITLLVAESLSGTNVSLRIDADEGSYVALARVADGNGDGRVTVLFDTAAAGSNRPADVFRAAAADDVATYREDTTLDTPLPAGVYHVSVLGAGCAQDHVTLAVEEPSTVTVTAYRGDRSLLAALATAADVREALAVGTLGKTHDREPLGDREGTPVLRGETLALAVEAPGLAADTVPTRGDGLAAFLERELSVSAVEGIVSVGGGEQRERYGLPDFGDWRAVADPGNDTFYLLLDTRGPHAPGGATDYGQVGERYVVTVEAADGADTTAVEFAEPAVALDTAGVLEEVVLPATAGATVTGTTDLPNGTTVTVGLRGPVGPAPADRTVAVEDGRFAATFDLAGVAVGTSFEVTVRHGGVAVDREPGRAAPAATVRFGDGTRRVDLAALDRVRVANVSVTDGGFVVVRRGAPDGPVVGATGYLSAGDHADVAVPVEDDLGDGAVLVAVAHRDVDGDRAFDPADDEAYRWGSPESTLRLETPTPTPTTTPPGTATAGPESPTPASATPTAPASATSPGDDPIPGPGPAVALAAVALAALGALRRRRRV